MYNVCGSGEMHFEFSEGGSYSGSSNEEKNRDIHRLKWWNFEIFRSQLRHVYRNCISEKKTESNLIFPININYSRSF